MLVYTVSTRIALAVLAPAMLTTLVSMFPRCSAVIAAEPAELELAKRLDALAISSSHPLVTAARAMAVNRQQESGLLVETIVQTQTLADEFAKYLELTDERWNEIEPSALMRTGDDVACRLVLEAIISDMNFVQREKLWRIEIMVGGLAILGTEEIAEAIGISQSSASNILDVTRHASERLQDLTRAFYFSASEDTHIFTYAIEATKVTIELNFAIKAALTDEEQIAFVNWLQMTEPPPHLLDQVRKHLSRGLATAARRTTSTMEQAERDKPLTECAR